MKRIDARDVYICSVVKQGEPRLRRSFLDTNFQDVSLFSGYVWEYEGEEKKVLCVRTYGGWKRVGTDEFYPKASKKNAGKLVVPNSKIKSLISEKPELIGKLIDAHKTYRLPVEAFKVIESGMFGKVKSQSDNNVM